jgi:two-component system sensor histidine kinase HupT/HoxJ
LDGLMNIPFMLLHLSTLLTFILLILMLRIKNKKALHYFSVLTDLAVFLWCFVSLIEQYATRWFNYSGMFFTNSSFSAVAFVSVLIFFLGYSFSHNESRINKKLYMLFAIPVICVILIWTNDYHHLYFLHYSPINSELKKGIVLQLHPIFSYSMIILGLFNLIRFSARNSGFFSKQSVLIIIGTVIPVAVDVAFVANIYTFPVYFEPISFSIAVICFMISIFRFSFLTIVPVALQTVVDHISDSYLVLNEQLVVTDFNKTFSDSFKEIAAVQRKKPISEIFKSQLSSETTAIISRLVNSAKMHLADNFEIHINEKNYDKYFIAEITPVNSNGALVCTIILFKDITEQKRDAELIAKTQLMLIESEHMASLGQLVGGIAHNLKTPIMSISGGLEGLTDLINEYEDSIGDDSVTADDHREIAGEMLTWIAKMKEYTAYMSDIITAVKGQAVNLTASTTESFEIGELIKRVEILMNHELKRFSCRLEIRCQLDSDSKVKGEINSFVQVINNLIINAIDAYEGREGVIELSISKDSDMVLFRVTDHGSGMTDNVKNRLFKEMITTKAKNGTGLGLYMSYSTITGRFGGKMWFDSVYGMGTSFYIMIPAA